MQALQNQSFLSSDSSAMDQLHDFLRRRPATEPLEDFDQIEQELHRLFVAAEREALGRELSRFDLDVPQVEINGERYDQVLRCETTYNSAAGPVRVERSLYRHPSGGRADRRVLDPAGGQAGELGSGPSQSPRERRPL
jgi:hypothetical protein